MDEFDELIQPLSPREALKEMRSLELSKKRAAKLAPKGVKQNNQLKLIAIMFIPILFIAIVVVAYSKREILARKVLDEAPKEPVVKEVLEPRAQKAMDDYDHAITLFNEARALSAIGSDDAKLKLARASIEFETLADLQITFRTKETTFEYIRGKCKENVIICQDLLKNSKSMEPARPVQQAILSKAPTELEVLQAKLDSLEQADAYNLKVQDVKKKIELLENRKAQERQEAEQKKAEEQAAIDRQNNAKLAEVDRVAKETEQNQKLAIQKIDHKNVNKLKDIDSYYNSPELLKYALQSKLETEKTLAGYKIDLEGNVIRFDPILNRITHDIESAEQEITATQKRIEEIVASGRKPDKQLYDKVSNLEGLMITLLNDRQENTIKQEIFKGGVFEREIQLVECRRMIEYIKYRLSAPKSESLTLLADGISDLEHERLYYTLILSAPSYLIAKVQDDIDAASENVQRLNLEGENMEAQIERKRYNELNGKIKEIKQLAIKKDFVRGHIDSVEMQINKSRKELAEMIQAKP